MLRCIRLQSLEELRAGAAAWDDLWSRSTMDLPVARAEPVAQWLEQFAADEEFRALVVEDDARWVAALPLVGARLFPAIRAGKMTVNSWVPPGGRLLLDMSGDVDRCLDLLAAEISGLPWRFLWLDEVPLDAACWQALLAAFARAGMPAGTIDGYTVGRIDIDHDWEAYVRRWSGTFRRGTLRLERRLAEVGAIRFETRRSFDPQELEGLLQRGWAVEHSSWKGRAGTSVLARGLAPFYLSQARELARAGQLQLTFLESAGSPIAFHYGAVGKGTYHACKIAYDDEYSRYNPGHLLYYHLLREMWPDPHYRTVNFAGRFTEAQRHWKPSTYRLGRMVVAPRRMVGRVVVHAHQRWWPRVRRVRRYFLDRRRLGDGEQDPGREAGSGAGSDPASK